VKNGAVESSKLGLANKILLLQKKKMPQQQKKTSCATGHML